MPRSDRWTAFTRRARAVGDEGQAILLFALLLTTLFGFVGLVVDVAWFQLNLVRVQRAADAGALAGSVYLPGNVPGAYAAAKAATAQNGFTDAVNGVVVDPQRDNVNTSLLNVTVTAPVRTWFMRMFGVTTFTSTRNARAEFILPVPMGSPQNYYGISRLCSNTACTNVGDAVTPANPLSSQGFWGAVITKGGNRQNGDLYSTYYNGNPTLNAQYDANGYSYQIDIPETDVNGKVFLYDPTYCATGKGNSGPANGQQLGTGDHWIGGSGRPAVTTEFKLWDMNGTPLTTSDDILVTTDGGLFTNKAQTDQSAAFGGDGNYGGSGGPVTDCQNDPYHNKWWQMATGLQPGSYRLQVQTSNGLNTNVNAENMFGIEATATGPDSPHVFGVSRMATYNNLPVNTSQVFYLAQIPAVHAGKTLEIKVHDLGDVGGDAFIKVLMPTTATYAQTTFNWNVNGGAFTNGANQIKVANSGSNLYDNSLITINIVLPANYTAPQPTSETNPNAGGGWFKIQYDLTNGGGGNDTATWSVNIRGNPVHLVTP